MSTKLSDHRLACEWQVDSLQCPDPFRSPDRQLLSEPDEPNLATVKVPDARLDLLTEMFQPQKRVPADVQYLDVAGIAKGIAEKGMSGALLGHLSQADALVLVARAFDDQTFRMWRAASIRRGISRRFSSSSFSATSRRRETAGADCQPENEGRRTRARCHGRERSLMERLQPALEAETPLREILAEIDPDDVKTLRGFGLLTAKPLLILLNLGEAQLGETERRLSPRVDHGSCDPVWGSRSCRGRSRWRSATSSPTTRPCS